jgi:hypothetical protein
MRTTGRQVARAAVACAVLAGAGLSFEAGTARGDDGSTAAKATYTLAPAFAAGEQFRVERRYRQTTLTTAAEGGGRRARARGDVDPLSYDAGMEVDALVTVEKVGEGGVPTAWTAKLERLRVDVPDPIQTQEHRLRQRERKQKRLPPNAHPLEGMTVRLEQDGAKPRLSRVLENGTDAGISERYPEVIPILQSFVDPDWSASKPVSVGAEWEMPADHVFRLTKVLAKAPLSGSIQCRLAAVTDGIASVDFTAKLSETYATVEMALDVEGTIEFDVEHRHQVGAAFKGAVSVSAKGSSLQGRGTIDGGNSFTVPTAPEDESK